MPIIYNNQETIIEKKAYYNNTLIKMKNNNPIFDIGSYIYYKKTKYTTEYHLVARFYKIFMCNTVSLEEVYYIINKLFPHEIGFVILSYYLKDNVHFRSINKNYGCKQTICIKYPECLFKSGIYIEGQNVDEYTLLIYMITNKLSRNFRNLLTKRKKFDINEIFIINDLELSIPHKIYNSNYGWGINLL